MQCWGKSCLESGRVVAEWDCLQSVHTSASNGLTHLALSHNTQKPKITIAAREMGRTKCRSFTLHNKAEHFQRHVTFGTCSVIFFDCLYHQIPVYNVPWDLKTSICAPMKANVKPSVGGDGWKGKVETARCFM